MSQIINEISGMLGAVLSAVLGVMYWLAKTTFDTWQKMLEARLASIEGDFKSLQADSASAVAKVHRDATEQLREAYAQTQKIVDRLHSEELATVRIDGELKLAKQANDAAVRDLAAIKEAMVTRNEWESGMNRVEKQLDTIMSSLAALQREGGRYSFSDRRSSSTSQNPTPPPPQNR